MHVLDASLLIGRVFVLRANQLYVSSMAVLPSRSALLLCMFDPHMFLRPQSFPDREEQRG